MLKVMFVDFDEIRLENTAKLVNWEKYDYYIAAKVKNSTQAVDAYLTCLPNLIVIELSMPIISGVALIRRIRKINSCVKILVVGSNIKLSESIDLINLGVSGYVKRDELDSEKLVECINDLKRKIIKDEKMQASVKEYELGRVIKHQGLDDFINKNLTEEYMCVDRFAIMVVKIDSPYNFWYNIFDNNEMPDSSIYPWDETKGEVSFLSVVQTSNDQWTILFNINRRLKSYYAENELNNISNRIQQWFRDSIGEKVSIAYSHSSNGFGDISRMYKSAAELLNHSIFMGSEAIINTDKTHQETSSETVEVIEYIKRIHNAVKEEDRDTIVNSVNYLFELAVTPKWNLSILKNVCVRLVHLTDFFKIDFGQRPLDKILSEDKVDRTNWYKIDDVKNFFIDEFDKLLLYLEQSRTKKYSLKVSQCIKYIYNNYERNIGLKEISEAIDVNNTYLGQRFKSEVGCTFSEYMTKFRINKAIVLLKDNKYKVYEVAKLVGFSSSQYFSRVFYKETGKYPTQYRTNRLVY